MSRRKSNETTRSVQEEERSLRTELESSGKRSGDCADCAGGLQERKKAEKEDAKRHAEEKALTHLKVVVGSC